MTHPSPPEAHLWTHVCFSVNTKWLYGSPDHQLAFKFHLFFYSNFTRIVFAPASITPHTPNPLHAHRYYIILSGHSADEFNLALLSGNPHLWSSSCAEQPPRLLIPPLTKIKPSLHSHRRPNQPATTNCFTVLISQAHSRLLLSLNYTLEFLES